MSYLNSQFEDDNSAPLFLKFSKVFEATSLHEFNRKIRKFESTHLRLTLVSYDNFTKTIPVTEEYLFSDTSHRYFKLLYTYKKYREIRYYRPNPDLAEWLATIDDFTKSKKLTFF